MLKLLQAQFNAISAISIREMQLQQATLMYGYAWALLDAVLSVGGLILIKVLLKGFGGMPGLQPMTFVLTGALPWFMFAALWHATSGTIKKHQKLLSFPGVTPLDIVFGAALQTLRTYGVVFLLTTTVTSAVEGVPFPRFPMGVILIFLSAWLMGVFLGLIFLPLTRLYPPAMKFISFPFRMGLFVSSVFFMITEFPSYVWPYMVWNPMLHVGELMRTYWFQAYNTPVGRPLYVAECLLGMGALGLLLERYARWRLPIV
jgi:capsular polysaccharide transport system permease protein